MLGSMATVRALSPLRLRCEAVMPAFITCTECACHSNINATKSRTKHSRGVSQLLSFDICAFKPIWHLAPIMPVIR